MGTTRYKALVAGGLGVIGRQLVTHLAALPDWEPIGLSRRAPGANPPARYLAVDLLDPDDVRAKLGELRDVTHIFHAAYQHTRRPPR